MFEVLTPTPTRSLLDGNPFGAVFQQRWLRSAQNEKPKRTLGILRVHHSSVSVKPFAMKPSRDIHGATKGSLEPASCLADETSSPAIPEDHRELAEDSKF